MQLPDYQILTRSDQAIELRLTVTEDLPCFRGHFEGLPVLAGVVQVDWAMALAEQLWQDRLPFQGMVSTKFQKLVRPPVTLTLTLKRRPGQLRFRFETPRGVCSSGIVRVAEHD